MYFLVDFNCDKSIGRYVKAKIILILKIWAGFELGATIKSGTLKRNNNDNVRTNIAG
jgi:hypothetical protein